MSSLKKQLKRIQQADRTVGGTPFSNNLRASFLFDEKEAALYDTDTIYALGVAGLEELQKLDPIFIPYEILLFSPTSKDLDRSLLTASENKAIDQNIRSFLRHLQPYFITKSAHKTLEWLIRKYRVHELNLDAVMDCILPYHETVEFVRMVQVLYFTDNDRWGFLFDVKKRGEAKNRTFLAQRCMVDRSILDVLFENVVWRVQNSLACVKKPAMLISFFAALTIEYLTLFPVVSENVIFHLYPIIWECIKGSTELQIVGYMIALQLIERVELSSDALNELIQLACLTVKDSSLEMVQFIAAILEAGRLSEMKGETKNAIKRIKYSRNIVTFL